MERLTQIESELRTLRDLYIDPLKKEEAWTGQSIHVLAYNKM